MGKWLNRGKKVGSDTLKKVTFDLVPIFDNVLANLFIKKIVVTTKAWFVTWKRYIVYFLVIYFLLQSLYMERPPPILILILYNFTIYFNTLGKTGAQCILRRPKRNSGGPRWFLFVSYIPLTNKNNKKGFLLSFNLPNICWNLIDSLICTIWDMPQTPVKWYKQILFQTSALWDDAFYMSKCPCVCPCVCSCIQFWDTV